MLWRGYRLLYSSLTTQCRQWLRALRMGRSTMAPKLCTLPPTTEAFEQSMPRAHHQLAQWYSTLQCVNRFLTAKGVPNEPASILELVCRGCVSDRMCRGGKCGCMSCQLVCTIFCACRNGKGCMNPFKSDSGAIGDNSDEGFNSDSDLN